MARRQQLTETQVADLFDPPTEQRELVRHYTLSVADLAAVRRCRGDHNRLGHALMLCYLRFPGRALRAAERPPAALLGFIAGQVEVLPGAVSDYLAGERTRQRQSVDGRRRGTLIGTRVPGVSSGQALRPDRDPYADLGSQVTPIDSCLILEAAMMWGLTRGGGLSGWGCGPPGACLSGLFCLSLTRGW